MKKLCKIKEWEINKEYYIDKILYLLIDRPTYINSYSNDFIWKNKKSEWHRDYDLPAIINDYKYIMWYKNDKKHRKNNKQFIVWNNINKQL